MANIEGAIFTLDKDVAQLKAKSQTTFESVNKLEQNAEFNATDIADLKRDLLELKFVNENLKKQLLYSESYSRRENLKFIGIVGSSSDSTDNQIAPKPSNSLHSENTKDALFKFLEDEPERYCLSANCKGSFLHVLHHNFCDNNRNMTVPCNCL